MTNKLLKGLGGCLALATLAVPAFCFCNTFAADMSVNVDGENIYSTGHNASNTAKYDKTTGTLTLDNFNGKHINIVNGGAKVVVNGTNKISYDASTSSSGFIDADGDLSFSGSGSITFSDDISNNKSCGVNTQGSIVVSGGTYNITCAKGYFSATNGDFTISGGQFSGGRIATGRYQDNVSANVSISGGTIKSRIGAYDNVNISGGEFDISGYPFLVYTDYGKVIISGGNFKLSGEDAIGIHSEKGVDISNATIVSSAGFAGIWSEGDVKINKSSFSSTNDGDGIWSKEGSVKIADSTVSITAKIFGIVAGQADTPYGLIDVTGDSNVSIKAQTSLIAYSQSSNAITLGEGLYYGTCNAEAYSKEENGYYVNNIWANDEGLTEIVISTTPPTCSDVKVPNTGASDSSNVGGAIFASLAAASAGVLVVCYLVRYSRKRVESRVRFKK